MMNEIIRWICVLFIGSATIAATGLAVIMIAIAWKMMRDVMRDER